MYDESVLPQATRKLIKEIAEDHIRGASQLFRRTLQVFPQVAEILPASKKQARQILKPLSRALKNAQPSMAPMVNLAHYVDQMMKNDFDVPVIASAFQAIPHAVERKLRKEQDAIVREALQVCAPFKKVLAHSRSSVVEAFLREWACQDDEREIWISESRPMQEGKMMAQALSDLTNRIVLLVDDARGLALNHVDFVIIGADRISETHVCNKIGSSSLACLAYQKKIPVIVLAEIIKFAPESVKLGEESSHAAAEICEDAPNIEIFNYYFEECPLNWIDKIVTPLGVKDKNSVQKIFENASWDILDIKQSV